MDSIPYTNKKNERNGIQMKQTSSSRSTLWLLLRRLILPVLLIAVSLGIFSLLPVHNYLSPRTLSQEDRFEQVYDRNEPYVTVTADKLWYTGLDYQHNGKVKGHYYYRISENRCQFYLLKSQTGKTPSETVEQVSLKGVLIPFDGSLYHSLTKHMAQIASWTQNGVESISSPYLLSTIPHYKMHQLVLMIALGFCILMSSLDIVKCFLLACLRRRVKTAGQ